MKLKGGYNGFTLSVRPSDLLWTELCPLCVFNNTYWFHFIPVHIMLCMKLFFFFRIPWFEFSAKFCKFDLYESIVWVILEVCVCVCVEGGGGGGGYSQNTDFLVALVWAVVCFVTVWDISSFRHRFYNRIVPCKIEFHLSYLEKLCEWFWTMCKMRSGLHWVHALL